MSEWMNEITCSEFTTHSAPSGWELHFRTPKQEDYIAVQDLCRKLIGHGKPPTNADRIRQMSDEELADFLENDAFEKPWCDPNAEIDPVTKECKRWDCVKCAVAWLQQEVDT